jgi:outer membrane protein assembly factor BamB
MNERAVVFVAVALMIATSAISVGQDYPQWRGSNRDGSASGFIEPKAWPETLTRQWKVEVGEGYATPLVIGNVVYCFTRRNGDEVMTALDADSGKARWHASYPAPYTPSSSARAHGAGPKATPAFSDCKLFSLGISGIVAAFDALNGKMLWRTQAPAEPPFFSAPSSPLADNGLVIVHPGNYEPLTAFDANTGEIGWTAGDGGFFASPIIATLSGTRQVISVTQKHVIGVSVDRGEILWQFEWPGAVGGTMPVLFGDIVIVSGLNAGVMAFKPIRRKGTWTTERVWETKDVSMYLSNPVVIGETLFGLSHRASGQFFAIDARTGKVLWLGQPREAVNTAVVKASDLLFLRCIGFSLSSLRSSPPRAPVLGRA